MTVRENLEFPLVRNLRHLRRQQITHAVEEVLEAVGLSQAINQMPSGLSGGQKKRIGIARTLTMKQAIMLYAEPTAGLDPITCPAITAPINQVHTQPNTLSINIKHHP